MQGGLTFLDGGIDRGAPRRERLGRLPAVVASGRCRHWDTKVAFDALRVDAAIDGAKALDHTVRKRVKAALTGKQACFYLLDDVLLNGGAHVRDVAGHHGSKYGKHARGRHSCRHSCRG